MGTQSSDPINKFTDPITELLYQAIKKDGTLSYAAYGEQIGVSEATIKRRLGELNPEEVCAKFAHTTRHGAVKVLKMQVNI